MTRSPSYVCVRLSPTSRSSTLPAAGIVKLEVVVARSAIVLGTSVELYVLAVPACLPTGTVNARVQEPWAVAAAIVKLMRFAQGKVVSIVKAKCGVLLDPMAWAGISAYDPVARVTVTPGVLVERVADTFVRVTVPSFRSKTGRTISSPGSTAPFASPAPPVEQAST